MKFRFVLLMFFSIACKPKSSNESIDIAELLKIKWNTPATNINIQITDISGKSRGPYKIRPNLYFLGSNFNLEQKDYIDDPGAPFLHHLRWLICDELASFGNSKTPITRKSCGENLASRPKIFPAAIEFRLEQITHNNTNAVLYTDLVSKDLRLTYYYPEDSNEEMKPFAIDALLDKSSE